MEQSLFKRFVRLGVPTVQLDAQGRARPSIASLYAWRYNNLGSLEHTKSLPEFTKANGGLQYDYQFIDVQDFEGRGESTPEPYFYQNLGEAEYVVGLYMYMRLRGYPAEKITILTTYNGQKALLRDVINARCVGNPLFGAPSKVVALYPSWFAHSPCRLRQSTSFKDHRTTMSCSLLSAQRQSGTSETFVVSLWPCLEHALDCTSSEGTVLGLTLDLTLIPGGPCLRNAVS